MKTMATRVCLNDKLYERRIDMFHEIPAAILQRMKHLEALDRQDREDNTPRLKRLRQVPRETGKFLALLAAGAPDGAILEIGTSAGYSTMWLALACREMGRRMTTFELLPEKIALASETFRLTGLEDVVTLVAGDALEKLAAYGDIAFCFLDAEKDVYADCYDLVVPRLVKGGLLVADNVISHEAELGPLVARSLADERLDAVVVPIGKGELVCRKKC
jgi:caffeoyl-CoA O-methyltransferase